MHNFVKADIYIFSFQIKYYFDILTQIKKVDKC